MKTAALMIGALAFVASACSSNSSTSSPLPATTTTGPVITTTTTAAPAPASCNRPHAAGQSRNSFTYRGQAREYLLYVPPAYTGKQNVPIIFNFHGYGSNMQEQMAYGNFRPEADRDNFLVVAPNGQSRGGRHWNLTSEPGLQNDVQMVSALLDHLEATLCIDTNRVYSTGMSDGGAMTSVLACVMPNRFAAFAPVAVEVFVKGCGGTRSIAIEDFKGTADPVVPYSGGRTTCCGHAKVAAAETSMAGWAAHDGCNATYTDTKIGTDVRKRTWHDCRAPGEVIMYIVDGGGHTWPGSIPVATLGKTTTTINATQLIWQFFAAHPLHA